MRKLKRIKKNLTPKQKKLCEKFIKLNNEEQAYFAAGYKGNGNHKAYIQTLFEKPEIKAYIEELKSKTETDLSNLKPKFQLFIKDYLTHFNASKSYRDNISPLEGASLYVAASQLLHTDQIQEALQKEMTARCEKLDVEGDRLVRMLVNIANNDPDGLLNDFNKLEHKDGEIPKPLKTFKIIKTWSGDLVDGVELLLSKQEVEEMKDVAISDRNKAIELLMKYKGMLIDRHDVSGKIDHNIKAGVLVVPGIMDEEQWLEQKDFWLKSQKNLLPEPVNNEN